MHDEEAVQLIFQDLEQPLDTVQRAGLDHYLASSEKTRKFAELVQKIEQAVQESRTVEQSGSTGPGLSDLARARLQRELHTALASKNSLEFGSLRPNRLVAESEGEYSNDNSDRGDDIPEKS